MAAANKKPEIFTKDRGKVESELCFKTLCLVTNKVTGEKNRQPKISENLWVLNYIRKKKNDTV